MSNLKIYVKSILIPLILGAIVSFITYQFIDYNSLEQPPLSPPSFLFPVVWTILYTLMGVSYGILKSNGLVTLEIKLIYYLQLAVNLLWPIAFFVLEWRLFAFIWLLLLIILIVIMIIKFYNQNKLAGLLQIPYLVWCIFAAYLNFGVYYLNR
ncbi:MAG: tryptophan-rich sensory protein [Clostridia bacterium]|nr:tryptophan-rich sensory protein [Clostridia bacterium]